MIWLVGFMDIENLEFGNFLMIFKFLNVLDASSIDNDLIFKTNVITDAPYILTNKNNTL